ncbi:hypothetical protein CVT25_011947 [Psilocybe cyanescens]|uniref:Uncharacterized protein n=1 Tax=Psilocybe cyanescens TaxID=93625 RepID=A0A409XQT4_PSICY|nr:hypothetical protein CVT25_011947 [Psilocybe cyanescens]
MTTALYQLSLNQIREEVRLVARIATAPLYEPIPPSPHPLTPYSYHGQCHPDGVVFSDGTVLLKNTTITVNVYSRHNDENIYPNARTLASDMNDLPSYLYSGQTQR